MREALSPIEHVALRANGDQVDGVFELRNDSNGYVPVALPVDGSGRGRNPALTFDLAPNEVEPQMGRGNKNELRAADFAVLGPGERRQLGWAWPPHPRAIRPLHAPRDLPERPHEQGLRARPRGAARAREEDGAVHPHQRTGVVHVVGVAPHQCAVGEVTTESRAAVVPCEEPHCRR